METSLMASCQPPDFNILCYSPARDMELKRESNNVYSLEELHGYLISYLGNHFSKLYNGELDKE